MQIRLPLTAVVLVVLTAAGLQLAATPRAAARLTGITSADGYVGNHPVSPFSHDPAVARLTPDLRRALQQATRHAAADGVRLRVNSGWRSRSYQAELLRRAVDRYGSEQAARRWVATPLSSAHVLGQAVDVGPPAAARWLERHGPAYGLCRVYANEPWHFERLTRPGGRCPALRPDAG